MDEKNLLSSAEADSNQAKYSLPPFKSLIILSIGPLIFELSFTLAEILDTYWVGKYIGKKGLSAIGCVFASQYIIHGFSNMIFVAITHKISHLHGIQSFDKLSTITFDIMRITIITALINPLIIYPVAKLVFIFLKTSKETSQNGFYFLIPHISGYITTGMLQLLSGIIYANGHSFLYAIIFIIHDICSSCLFAPIFIVVAKMGVVGSSLSAICANIVTIIILIFYLKRKYPQYLGFNWSSFFKKFDEESISALRVGFSAFLIQTALTLPNVVIQKFLSLSAHMNENVTEVMAMWSLLPKIYHISSCVPQAFQKSLLVTASHAFSSNDSKRFWSLFNYALLICCLWSGSFGFLFSFYPQVIGYLWSNEKAFSSIIPKYIPPTTYTSILIPVYFLGSTLLQSSKKSKYATTINIIGKLISLPASGAILYYLYKETTYKINWSYAITDGITFIVTVLFILIVLRK